MQLHKHNQTTFGSKSTFEYPQETPRAFIPSKGKRGALVRLRDAIYLRSTGRQLYRVPKWAGENLVRDFEERAAKAQRVRYALAFLVGIVLGIVAWLFL